MATDYDSRLKKARDTIEYSGNAAEVLVAAQTAAALEQARVRRRTTKLVRGTGNSRELPRGVCSVCGAVVAYTARGAMPHNQQLIQSSGSRHCPGSGRQTDRERTRLVVPRENGPR